MTEKTETNRHPTDRKHSALRYDPDSFRDHLAGMSLTRVQEDALLEDVWRIVVGVIDHAFGSHQSSASGRTENRLASDSESVLRSIIISTEQKARDAEPDKGLHVPRKDS